MKHPRDERDERTPIKYEEKVSRQLTFNRKHKKPGHKSGPDKFQDGNARPTPKVRRPGNQKWQDLAEDEGDLDLTPFFVEDEDESAE